MDALPLLKDTDVEEQEHEFFPTADSAFSDFVADHRLQKSGKRPALRREKIARAYDDAFELIGGVPRLALWAHEDPKEFYKLHAKLIPTEQKNQFDGTIRVIGFVQPTELDGLPPIEGEVDGNP
jgi:hypothetical protein